MSQVSNVKNINFSTAFETDKICGIYAGTFSNPTAGGPGYQFIIPHTFTRPAFCDTLASIDGGNTYDPTLAITYSDANNLYVNVGDNTKTYTYKVVTTWIDNYDTTNPLITPVFQTLSATYPTTTFDSRKNYQKILLNQPTVLNNPGTGNTGTTPVAHNLGYNPNYKLYFESLPGQVWPAIGLGDGTWLYDFAHQYQIQGVVDTVNLNLSYQGGSSSPSTFRAWYKIYYDG